MPIGTSEGEQFPGPAEYELAQAGYTPPVAQAYEAIKGAAKRTLGPLMAPGKAFKQGLTPEEETAAAGDIALMVGGSSFPLAGFKPGLGMFGGRFSKEAVSAAEGMERSGASVGTIKELTGLEKGAEGKWRKEFSDEESRVKEHKLPESGKETTLGEIFHHPELYKTYPAAKDIVVKSDPTLASTTYGNYKMENGIPTIRLNPYGMRDIPEVRKTLLHETQHYIQDVEGFSKLTEGAIPGGLKEEVKGHYARESTISMNYILKFLDDFERTGNPQHLQEAKDLASSILQTTNKTPYEAIASEVEARNVETRAAYDAAKIRKTPAEVTEDYPREAQITEKTIKNYRERNPNPMKTLGDYLEQALASHPK